MSGAYPMAQAFVDKMIDVQRAAGRLRDEPTPEKREEAIRACIIVGDRIGRRKAKIL